MLRSLRLQNFRGFQDHTIPLRDLTVLVGANNAGKSSAVEALRLVALVSERVRVGTAGFTQVPRWLEHPQAFAGVAPAIRGKPTDGHEASLFHRYGEPPAVITATFASGTVITAFVGPEARLHGVARFADGTPASRRSRQLEIDQIAVQPQVTPLLRDENVLREATVRRGEGTYLAPQHFRNQLSQSDRRFRDFAELAEATWPGLQIQDLRVSRDDNSRPVLRLSVRDHDFVGEVSLMGHGLQMWLQLMWFLSRTPRDAIVVFDEPDVFMHPDLQRRLLDLIRRRFHQLIIATHSVEILSDVDVRSILNVDRRATTSTFVSSLPKLQEVLDALGTVQNVQVTRLLRARSFYLVEGDDVRLLRVLQQAIDPDAHPIDVIPNAELGGRGGWGSGIPARLPTKNASGQAIRSYCLLDRDYFPDDEVEEREAEAVSWNIELRVWSRKEIENFLLVPAAIHRLISSALPGDGPAPPVEDIEQAIDGIVESMRDEPIFQSMTACLAHRDRRGGVPQAMKLARARIERAWEDRDARWALAPGKAVLAALSQWSADHWNVSFGPETVARELRHDEIAPEVVDVITGIPAARRLRAGSRAAAAGG